uniref:GRF-type domain-containing protein n=1 Tax=Oryza glaberrima TaxID=4538 RepID=I1R3G0_ORYGL
MEAPFLECLNWRSDPFAGWFPPWCDRPLCTCGDRCILKSSLMVETRGRRFFQCANLDQTYRTLCNYIEWVDTENLQNDGTRPYARSESRSDYLRRKDEHERRIAVEALEWQGNPRRCAFTLWIDNVNPTYDGQKITESETQVEYQREKDHQNAIHVERRGRGR